MKRTKMKPKKEVRER